MKKIAEELEINWIEARHVSLEDATQKWIVARKKYMKTRHLHEEWRRDFQHSLIDALAKTEHLPKETIKKRMKREVVLCPWVLWTKNTRPDLTALFTNGQMWLAGQTDV